VTERGASRLLGISLVLATFIVLAAIGWGVSVGLRIYLANETAAEARPQETHNQESAKPVATPIAAPAPPVDLPRPRTTEEIAAEIDARVKAAHARLEHELDVAARAVDEEPLRVGGEVSAPVKLSGRAPAYTETARRARIQGVVILEAIIDRSGVVTATRVLKGLPMGLDRQAEEAVRSWRFEPARRAGEPVPVWYALTVEFRVQ